MQCCSHLKRGFIITSAILTVACSVARTQAEELPAIPIVPANMKILILPTLDQTGDRSDMQKEHINFGNHRLEYEFITREFWVIGPDMAIRTARSNDIDLDDDDSRTKGTMRHMAKLTGADWVVSVAIVEVKKDASRLGNRRARAKVKLRIFDTKQDGWIADRFFEDHKDSFGVGVGTTGLFRAAIDTTVQRSTANLIDMYPLLIKVFNEFGEKDYLAGQTTPFIGDRKKTFNGLDQDKPEEPDQLKSEEPKADKPKSDSPQAEQPKSAPSTPAGDHK